MKIGILGGSFDPIHNGHLNMALKAYEQYHLDEVWLIPNGNAPHKDTKKMADAKDRLTMCELVAKEYTFLKACDIEIISKEYSYTYITVTKLQEQYPDYEFYFIMGADSLDYFDRWRKPEIIASICKILVINRDEFSEKDMAEKIERINMIFPADIRIVHCPKIDVSSTELRQKLDKNDVLPAVYEYICQNDLYGN